MKEVAQELDVKLVDLSSLSVAYYDSIGPEAAKSVFLFADPGVYQAFPNGVTDNTHFQKYGAIQIARLVAGGVKELGLPLSGYVKETDMPETVPAKPEGLTAGSISNAGAVLKWNPVDAAEMYKVYRKLASEPETSYAMIGTTTVPTMTIGGMAEGAAYTVRVTAVNGRGESAGLGRSADRDEIGRICGLISDLSAPRSLKVIPRSTATFCILRNADTD